MEKLKMGSEVQTPTMLLDNVTVNGSTNPLAVDLIGGPDLSLNINAHSNGGVGINYNGNVNIGDTVETFTTTLYGDLLAQNGNISFFDCSFDIGNGNQENTHLDIIATGNTGIQYDGNVIIGHQ